MLHRRRNFSMISIQTGHKSIQQPIIVHGHLVHGPVLLLFSSSLPKHFKIKTQLTPGFMKKQYNLIGGKRSLKQNVDYQYHAIVIADWVNGGFNNCFNRPIKKITTHDQSSNTHTQHILKNAKCENKNKYAYRYIGFLGLHFTIAKFDVRSRSTADLLSHPSIAWAFDVLATRLSCHHRRA